ncbi:MAG: Gfo/Idh/MocA family protein [Chitinophagales bacterium]
MSDKYKVLIIGAGKIAALFDLPGSGKVLTHAHAVVENERLELVGFTDVDYERAKTATQIWGGQAFASLDEALGQDVDIAVVTAPDEYHYEVLMQLVGYPLRVVLAEKPLAKSLANAMEIKRIYENNEIPVLVNYTRRFVPEFQSLKARLNQCEYGRLLAGNCYYGKGMLHNGSHLVDLLRFLFGEITGWSIFERINDFYDDDPSLSAVLKFDSGENLVLQAVDCRAYSLFELDLLFEKQRIRVVDSGFVIEEHQVVEDQIYSGYRRIRKGREFPAGLGDAMALAYDNIVQYLDGTCELKCTLNDAYRAMTICIGMQSEAL